MGLPGHKRTRSHKHRRASHFALKKELLSTCLHCGTHIAPHTACRVCGYYRGRQVVVKKLKKITKK